jgi:hypothetical protein
VEERTAFELVEESAIAAFLAILSRRLAQCDGRLETGWYAYLCRPQPFVWWLFCFHVYCVITTLLLPAT